MYKCFLHKYDAFLGKLAKLQKVTTSFIMSVRLEQLGSHWMDFHEIDI
jgi:hypothetical protein